MLPTKKEERLMSTNDLMMIEDMLAREMLDSRGNPTVEVTVMLLGG
jgi:enolase